MSTLPRLLAQQSISKFWCQLLPPELLLAKVEKPSLKFRNKLEQESKCPKQMIFIQAQRKESDFYKVLKVENILKGSLDLIPSHSNYGQESLLEV